MLSRALFERLVMCDCDDRKRSDTQTEIENFTSWIYSLRVIGEGDGRRMRINHTPYRKVGELPLCPCGRKQALETPWPIPTSHWHGNGYGHPFRGNQHVGMLKIDNRYYKRVNTHICATCCGYVVPVAHPHDADPISPLNPDSMVRSDPMVLLPRRSVRVRNARLGMTGDYEGHVMLDGRGRLSRNRVGNKGFESRVVKR